VRRSRGAAVDPGRAINVVVVEPEPHRRMALGSRLGDRANRRLERSLTSRSLLTLSVPSVIVFGPSLSHVDHIDEIAELLASHHDSVGVLAAHHVTAELMQRAMRAGISDVVSVPGELEDLPQVIARVADRSQMTGVPEHVEAARSKPGKVIMVFGPKGGSGKSTIAVNVAAHMARRLDQPIALVDADLQFGDDAVMLNVAPTHTIADAVAVSDPDPALMRNLMVRHPQTGLLVLPAPVSPALADQITTDDVVRIVGLIRSFASHVVIDTPAYFTDVILGLLDVTDEILLVAAMDVPSVKNVKLGLGALRQLDVPDAKIRLVLNRTKSKAKMDVGDVERVLGRSADAFIPSDIVVPQSINRSLPVVLGAPNSEVAHSLVALAERVMVPDRRKTAAHG
jgi:pilus assembly protein CpaE